MALPPVRGAAGYVVAAWCGVFAVLHVYWALGGDAGLASSAGAGLAAQRPAVFVVFGLWGVAALLVAGAAFGVALTGRPSRGYLRRGMVILGWIAGALLLIRGLLLEFVLLTGLGGVASAVGPLETRWSLILWNPWFVVGGLALVLATRRFQRRGVR